MAIHYIVGNPGSGKSYYGVYILYDKFIRTKKTNFFSRFTKQKEQKQYDFGYTNINEFNFDSSYKIRKLELEPLKEKLSLLYNMYKLNAPDSELIETAKSFDLFNVIFVIDEIHNFFVSKDEVLIWWLTYHRHLHHELYLITQDLSLVDNEYKRIAEFFYRAVDSSKRFFSKKFRYFQYTSYRLYEKDLVRRFHIDFIQEVFNLYHSGNDNIRSSYLRKFLYISCFLLIFTFFLFYMLKSFVTPSDDTSKPSQKFTDSNKTKVITSIRQNLPSDKIDDTLGFYYKYTCVVFDCKFDNSDDLFDVRLLSYLLSKTEILYKIDSIKSKNSVETNIIIKDDVFKVLNITLNTNKNSKGLTDDFKNPSFASGSSIFLPTLSGRNN